MKKRSNSTKVKKMLKIQSPKSKDVTEKPDDYDYTCTNAFRINNFFKPPYEIIVDTNFINFCVKRKIDIYSEFLNCLLSNSKLFVTECVIGELEKLGRIYRVALSIVKDKLFNRLTFDHKGTYADDCIFRRVHFNRCYMVATCDTELKNRLKKLQSVPIIYIRGKKFVSEGFLS